MTETLSAFLFSPTFHDQNKRESLSFDVVLESFREETSPLSTSFSRVKLDQDIVWEAKSLITCGALWGDSISKEIPNQVHETRSFEPWNLSDFHNKRKVRAQTVHPWMQ